MKGYQREEKDLLEGSCSPTMTSRTEENGRDGAVQWKMGESAALSLLFHPSSLGSKDLVRGSKKSPAADWPLISVSAAAKSSSPRGPQFESHKIPRNVRRVITQPIVLLFSGFVFEIGVQIT
ncbi:unnamed protein product [Bursaphelenchus xylophilus]|uniref:(pine wood nematode) hypothetical protein n=1 Tax=Bursaphelenchus xylophilus TaxID=6326 RepID=A0A1I7SUF2_BURXY|nr:unnamed protein product [Bursaphelenchus xylophilus]CAG9107203.1 unnamed protein product [Bursaphelenchus xylophilus]